MKHPHALPQEGGSHVLTRDGKLERREWTKQPGEPGFGEVTSSDTLPATQPPPTTVRKPRDTKE